MVNLRVRLGALVAAAFALVLGSASMAHAQTPVTQIVLGAVLLGTNEVPGVTTNARGYAIAVLDSATFTLTWQITYAGLSGPAIGAHFHGPAPATMTAPVVLAFTNVASSPIVGRQVVTPQQAAELLAGQWYVNIHTTANMGGEIRGQMKPGVLLGATLSGANENPPRATEGTGTGWAFYVPQDNTLSWYMTFSGLTGPATQSHFHGPAAPTVNVGVVLAFPNPVTSPVAGMQVITVTQAAEILGGMWYFNVHTAMFTGGEIRGQVTQQPVPVIVVP